MMQPDLYPTTRQRSGNSLNPYEERELTLRDLLQMFRRRRGIMFVATAVIFALGILLCVFSTRRYQAVGTIQVQKESSDGLDLDTLMGAAGDTSDALNADINIQTQASILQSNELALRVIHKLGLEDTPEFRPKSGALGGLLRTLFPDESSNPSNAAVMNARRQAGALSVFHKRLTVKPQGGTRLIEIDYLNPDPKLAAAVVNELVQELSDYTFESRYKATEAASASLSVVADLWN